jgi:hypothetical protein
MRGVWPILLLAGLLACGGDKGSGPAVEDTTGTEPAPPPVLARVDGVTIASGGAGTPVLLEGTALGDSADGAVYFRSAGGARVRATAYDSDWSSTSIVAIVPAGLSGTSALWVEVGGQASDTLPYRIVSRGVMPAVDPSWTVGTSLPAPRQAAGAGVVAVDWGANRRTLVFVIGGEGENDERTSTVYSSTLSSSDGAPGSWTTGAATLQTGRTWHAVAVATPYNAPIDTSTPGVLYAIGGADQNSNALTTVEMSRVGLDGAPSAFTFTSPLPVALYAASAVVARGFVWVAGGSRGGGLAQSTAYRAAVQADGTLGGWESVAALPHPATAGAFIALGRDLYFSGGDTIGVFFSSGVAGYPTDQVWTARIGTRGGLPEWTPTTSLSEPRSRHVGVALGDQVLLATGYHPGSLGGTAETTHARAAVNGSLGAWSTTAGPATIRARLGHSLYDAAMASWMDGSGNPHAVLIGGARQGNLTSGRSASVLYF